MPTLVLRDKRFTMLTTFTRELKRTEEKLAFLARVPRVTGPSMSR